VLPGDCGAALEIGTGNGALLAHLRAMGFSEVTGIDPSRAAADSAAPAVRPMIRVESFDGASLPRAHYSLIVANQTLEHVTNPYELLEAVRQLLRPRGTLMIVSHNYGHPLMRLLGARSPIIDIEHLQVFSPASLELALTRAGFQTVEIRAFANRYPLHSSVRLMPIPRTIKRPLHAWLRRGKEHGMGGNRVKARVGNMVAWASG
jgi:SAM-dependent methyltransferase